MHAHVLNVSPIYENDFEFFFLKKQYVLQYIDLSAFISLQLRTQHAAYLH